MVPSRAEDSPSCIWYFWSTYDFDLSPLFSCLGAGWSPPTSLWGSSTHLSPSSFMSLGTVLFSYNVPYFGVKSVAVLAVLIMFYPNLLSLLRLITEVKRAGLWGLGIWIWNRVPLVLAVGQKLSYLTSLGPIGLMCRVGRIVTTSEFVARTKWGNERLGFRTVTVKYLAWSEGQLLPSLRSPTLAFSSSFYRVPQTQKPGGRQSCLSFHFSTYHTPHSSDCPTNVDWVELTLLASTFPDFSVIRPQHSVAKKIYHIDIPDSKSMSLWPPSCACTWRT